MKITILIAIRAIKDRLARYRRLKALAVYAAPDLVRPADQKKRSHFIFVMSNVSPLISSYLYCIKIKNQITQSAGLTQSDASLSPPVCFSSSLEGLAYQLPRIGGTQL